MQLTNTFISRIINLKYLAISDEENQDPGDSQQSAAAATADPAPAKKPIKLSYEEYKQMANLFVIYMRKQEEEAAGKNCKWWCRWLSARLQYLQCVSTGDTTVLHWAIEMRWG